MFIFKNLFNRFFKKKICPICNKKKSYYKYEIEDLKYNKYKKYEVLIYIQKCINCKNSFYSLKTREKIEFILKQCRKQSKRK